MSLWKRLWEGQKLAKVKGQSIAANVSMPPLTQAILEYTLKHTLEKSRTNATNVIMHAPE